MPHEYHTMNIFDLNKKPEIDKFDEFLYFSILLNIFVTYPNICRRDQKEQPCLTLPETYKRLHDKFNTSDQVLNLLARRQETCTFQKLQRNVQEICRKSVFSVSLLYLSDLSWMS